MTINTSKLSSATAKTMCEDFCKAYPALADGAVITKIEISGCQGSRRTGKIELSYDGDDITDQKSVSKSEVRWIDIKALSFKSTITTRISTLCSRLCIRYSNMWILPVSSMQEFLEEAQEIEREFQAGIKNVVENYESYIQAEKDRSPLMADLIDQLKLTKDDFTKSFKFNLAHFIPFSPISIEDDETDGVYQEQLLIDIADEAGQIYEKINPRDNMRSTTIARLKQMQSKIISFMFIHKEAAVLADAIKHVVNNLPTGAIKEPRDVAVLKQWFYFMSDVAMLKRIITGEEKVTEWLDLITQSFNQPNRASINNSLKTSTAGSSGTGSLFIGDDFDKDEDLKIDEETKVDEETVSASNSSEDSNIEEDDSMSVFGW